MPARPEEPTDDESRGGISAMKDPTATKRARVPDLPSPTEAAAALREENAALRQQLAELQKINRTLSDSEQRLRLAIATGRIGLWVWNSTDVTNAGDWSPRMKEVFGLPRETDVTHEIFLACVHPEDREKVNAAVMQSLGRAHAGEYQCEYRIHRHNDRELRWVTARGQAFFDPDGTPVRFIGTLMDITERKAGEETWTKLHVELERRVAERTEELARSNRALQLEVEERKRAEDALRRREDDLRVAIDAIPGLVWTSLPDGKFDYLNQRWLEYTGMRQEDATGWGWQAAIHPEDLSGLLQYWESILADGTVGRYEARMRRLDGEFRWFLFQGVPLLDETGKVAKWYGTNTDIEATRASERLAREQEEALRQTLAGIATESEPEKFLEHVLQTMADRLGAEGIGAWEMNEQTRQVEFAGSWEDGKLRRPEKNAGKTSSPFSGLSREHPVWTEFFSNGEYCVIGEIRSNDVYVRSARHANMPWHPFMSAAIAYPDLPGMVEQLRKKGVVTTVCVPMFIGGKVKGLLSVRFLKQRELQCFELELARALAHQAMLAIQLAHLTEQSREAAVALERSRMARDIHDTLAQGFTGVIIQLEAAEDAETRGLTEEKARHLSRAKDLARESLKEARRSVRALRPQALEQVELPAALDALFAKLTTGSALKAELIVDGAARRLNCDLAGNLLRITQEALTNVLRHSSARQFTTRLIYEERSVRLELRDDGVGFDPSANHEGFGLLGMRERVESMGGQIIIESSAAQGAAISIVIPAAYES